jgi:hypothetical protein
MFVGTHAAREFTTGAANANQLCSLAGRRGPFFSGLADYAMAPTPLDESVDGQSVDDKPHPRDLSSSGIAWLLVPLGALVLICLYSIVYLLVGHFTVRVFIFRFTIRALWQPVILGLCAAAAWAGVWHIWLRADGVAASSGDAVTAAIGPRAWSAANPGRTWTACLWTIAGGAVGSALLWCGLALPPTAAEAYTIGDGALTELYTLYASRGVWGLGPYSRFHWNHPGPLLFYCFAPFYLASHLSAVALNAGAFAINIASLATIFWATVRYAGAALSGILAIAVGCYLWRTEFLLTSAWNPHIVLVPLVLLLVAAAVVASGRLSMLPAVIAAASFTAQTHIGLVPLAGSMTLCAVAAGLWHPTGTSGRRARWQWLVVSIGLGLVLWLPPLVEQMSPNGGNLGKIVRFFLTPDQSDETPRRVVIQTWATAWSASLRPGLSVPYGDRLALRKDAETATAVAAAVPLLWVFGSWAARRGRLVEAWCCRLSGVGSIVALVAVQRIRGGIADHLVSWVTIIGLVSVVSLAAVACIWLGERVPVLARLRWRRVASAVTIVLVAWSVWDGGRRLEAVRRDLSKRGVHISGERPTRTPVESLYAGTSAFLAEANVRKPRIEPRGDAWAQMAGIVVQLHKRNIPVAVSANTVWMFGAPLAPGGDEDAELIIADAPSRARLSQRTGDCVLTERDGLSVHVLLSSLRNQEAAHPCK